MVHPEWPHEVHTDVSTVGVGCVLLQHHSQANPHFTHYMIMLCGIWQCFTIVYHPQMSGISTILICFVLPVCECLEIVLGMS